MHRLFFSFIINSVFLGLFVLFFSVFGEHYFIEFILLIVCIIYLYLSFYLFLRSLDNSIYSLIIKLVRLFLTNIVFILFCSVFFYYLKGLDNNSFFLQKVMAYCTIFIFYIIIIIQLAVLIFLYNQDENLLYIYNKSINLTFKYFFLLIYYHIIMVIIIMTSIFLLPGIFLVIHFFINYMEFLKCNVYGTEVEKKNMEDSYDSIKKIGFFSMF